MVLAKINWELKTCITELRQNRLNMTSDKTTATGRT